MRTTGGSVDPIVLINGISTLVLISYQDIVDLFHNEHQRLGLRRAIAWPLIFNPSVCDIAILDVQCKNGPSFANTRAKA